MFVRIELFRSKFSSVFQILKLLIIFQDAHEAHLNFIFLFHIQKCVYTSTDGQVQWVWKGVKNRQGVKNKKGRTRQGRANCSFMHVLILQFFCVRLESIWSSLRGYFQHLLLTLPCSYLLVVSFSNSNVSMWNSIKFCNAFSFISGFNSSKNSISR